MSRTTTRIAAGALLGLAVTGSTLVAAPAALAVPTPAAPVVNPTSVKAGEDFTVSGVDCDQSSDPANPIGAVAFLDLGPDAQMGIGNGGEADPDGAWTLTLGIPEGFAPGVYDVISLCVSYMGDYEVEYPTTTVTVVDPAAKPSTPATSTPAAPAATPAVGAIRGTAANTAGVTSPDTGAATGDRSAPGAVVVKVLRGFKPFEKVTVTLHSTPWVAGTFTADAQGVVRVQFTVPAGTPVGQHTLVYNGDQNTYFQEAFTVARTGSGSQLAYTGADVKLPLFAGAGLVALGGATVFAARRRKAEATQA
ncbi:MULTISPECIES: LPXTG cell wall anchor domain-containing protein [unclassified Geodermatophilus]|uniref:LPXTG cell wall anchor domain-containing protein n=1 Tax=unclassified Geodermatophilus TaxID=2637632 RepID=UPI003EEC96E1